MKSNLTTCIAIASACITSTLVAEPPFDRDLKQLKEQRDRAIAAASEPINRRYRESLEQLLRRATQGNDLDTALKVKTELATVSLGSATAPASRIKTTEDLTAFLAGSIWSLAIAGKDKSGATMEFKKDGKAIMVWFDDVVKTNKWWCKDAKTFHVFSERDIGKFNDDWTSFEFSVLDGSKVTGTKSIK